MFYYEDYLGLYKPYHLLAQVLELGSSSELIELISCPLDHFEDSAKTSKYLMRIFSCVITVTVFTLDGGLPSKRQI